MQQGITVMQPNLKRNQLKAQDKINEKFHSTPSYLTQL